MSETLPGSGWRTAARIGVVVVAIALIVTVFNSPLRGKLDPRELVELLVSLREAAQTTWYAPLAFIAAFVIGAALFMPATLFILSAAFFWGWLLGGLYAWIGGVVCAALSFELSRYVFGDLAARIFGKRLPRLHRLLDHAGMRSVMLLRIIPGIPFPVFNFGAGLTSLRSRDYLIGTAIGLTVPTFIITFSADAIFDGTLGRGQVAGRLLIAALLLGALIVVPTLIARRSRIAPALEARDPEESDREETSSMVN